MSYLLSPVPISLLTIAKIFYQQKKGQNLTSLIPKFTLARAVFLAKRVCPACYFALHDSLRDTGPDNAQLYGEKRSQLAAGKTIFCLNVVFCPPATATPTTANAGSGADSRGFRSA